MKKIFKKILISVLLVLVGGGINFYINLPALNPKSSEFWSFLAFVIFLAVLPFIIVDKSKVIKKNAEGKGTYINIDFKSLNFIAIGLIVLPLIVILVGNIFSSTIFNAKRYASLIDVETVAFEEDMPETNDVTNVALMDTSSAIIIGNRALGSLSEVVSQYQSSNVYSQINYGGTPKKVSSLEYADFFKWLGNRDRGVPGYIMVDPVYNTSEYKKLKNPIHYTESGYFGDDLMRKLRLSYPTKIFGTHSFEIDENGDPYYIFSCLSPRIGLFGAYDVSEVIIFNPCDGSSEIYDVENTPSWIDIVYDGYLATKKYNWQGMLSGGYWNSVIGNVGCKQTTDDFGYVVRGDDVWYFTGVTSIAADESNIGFILSNARTGEYKFYPVVGAEEYSAMNAAEGEVQEKGYIASFPSLINVAGEATYIMVLKDSGGLVKLYALVNVEQYSIVATGETQAAVMASYKKLLRENGVSSDAASYGEEYTFGIVEVRMANIGNESFIYLLGNDGKTYKGNISVDESLITLRSLDTITVTATESDTEGIFDIESWQFAK
ncbi:MAG: hypothetical protein IKJ91_03455 [Clostridia bacterium]|nr:hypothetical protein [Clostridia bacterium]